MSIPIQSLEDFRDEFSDSLPKKSPDRFVASKRKKGQSDDAVTNVITITDQKLDTKYIISVNVNAIPVDVKKNPELSQAAIDGLDNFQVLITAFLSSIHEEI